MTTPSRTPRILIVTPEVTYLPNGMGNVANLLSAKAGGLADVSAALISALFEQYSAEALRRTLLPSS